MHTLSRVYRKFRFSAGFLRLTASESTDLQSQIKFHRKNCFKGISQTTKQKRAIHIRRPDVRINSSCCKKSTGCEKRMLFTARSDCFSRYFLRHTESSEGFTPGFRSLSMPHAKNLRNALNVFGFGHRQIRLAPPSQPLPGINEPAQIRSFSAPWRACGKHNKKLPRHRASSALPALLCRRENPHTAAAKEPAHLRQPLPPPS